MPSNSSAVDYITTYFEHPTLSKIHGEPNFVMLRKLKTELMQNASSVPSDLGGGANGHLGLLLTSLEYQCVSAVAYVRPVHPGILVIPHPCTQHETTRLTTEHKQQVLDFRETINVEKAMVKQVVHAIDSQYIDTLRKRITDCIDTPIVTVLHHLFSKYGKVDAESLASKEKIV